MKSFYITLLFGVSLLFNPLVPVYAQKTVASADSALLDRINALEKQVKYNKSGEDHFMMAGLATLGFVANRNTTTFNGNQQISKTSSFPDGDHFEFSPLFLWRHGNKFLLEFEPSFAGDQLGVNWADVSYFITSGLIIRGGYLVLPFGTYSKRLAAGWIDKLATDPVGVADLPPLSNYGVEVEGGIQAGTMKWSYDMALSNGLQLLPDGTIQSAGITDNNRNKMFTGRIGWLPLSNSSLELGASLMTGKVGDAGTAFAPAKASLYAFDVNLVENIQPFQLNIKGQYNIVNINRNNYRSPVDSSVYYTFKNRSTSAFIQASLRPSFVNNKIVKNFEVAARYGNFTTPANSLWGAKTNALTVGLDYWLTWRSVVKFTYEAIKSTNTTDKNLGGETGSIRQSNSMYLQFAIQL
jgi:hypothetical protein